MNILKMMIIFLSISPLSYAMDREQSMGAVTIKNITKDKSVIIPADLIPFKTIHHFKEGTITSPLSPQFFQLLKDLLYANKTMTCLQKNDLKCTKNIIKLLENNQYNLPDDFASWFELAYLIDMFDCSPALYDGLAFYFAHAIKDKTDAVITALNNLPITRKPGAQAFLHQVEIFYMLSFEEKITAEIIDGYSIKELLLCNLIEIEKETGDGHDALKHILNLSDFNIDSLHGFDDIPDIEHITHLIIDNNKIQALPDNFLSQCIHLLQLNLSGNQITVLPQNFLQNNLPLISLDLSDNKLSLLPDAFLSRNVQLKKLSLDYNDLITLPEGFLSACTALQEINLAHNQLIVLPNNFLSTCPYVYSVYLQNNQLQTLPDNFLAQATALNILIANNNSITVLPQHFLENNNQPQFFLLLDVALITNLATLSPHLQEAINQSIAKMNHLREEQEAAELSETDEPAAKRIRL